MKVGDLVKYSRRKTRKGMPYEDTIGVITKIDKPAVGVASAKVIFDIEYTFNIKDLEVVSESR
jgi:hypothetical protein